MKINPTKPIHALNGSNPHPTRGSWKEFLATCEVRDTFKGVTFFGSANCNYIVFKDGTLVQNFGYHGKALMNRLREEGIGNVKRQIIKDHEEIQQTIERLKNFDPTH